MNLDIRDLRETLEINRDDLVHNRMLVNELIIDDLLCGLGYNKKRDNSVKRFYSGDIDWEVVRDDIRLAVKAVELEGDNKEAIVKAKSFCMDKRYSVLIITDGSLISILRFDKERLKYKTVARIHVEEDLDESQEKVLRAISKDEYDLRVLDDILRGSILSYEKVLEILTNNHDEFKAMIARLGNTKVESVQASCEKILKSVENSTDIEDVKNLEEENFRCLRELDNAKKQLAEKEDKLNAALKELYAERQKYEDLEYKISTKEISEPEIAEKDIETQKLIDDYVAQIKNLANDLSEKEAKLKELNEIVAKQKEEIESLSGEDKKKVLELLNVIVDSPSLDRSYVAAINNELLQYEELHTFVGRVLQKLYDLKSFKASQHIFNGDMFRLNSRAVRNDLIMNNKPYDVTVSVEQEDAELNKLRILFSHFEDINFECKKIGTLREKVVDDIEDTEESSEIIVDESPEEESKPKLSLFKREDRDDEYTEVEDNTPVDTENDSEMDTPTDGFSSEDSDWELADSETDNNELPRVLLVQNLTNIDGLVWTDENVKFNNIKYIGEQETTFAINLSMDATYDMLLCKCIDAVVALEVLRGNNSVITYLKQKDFSFINNSIKLYTDEYRNYPRINGTRYAIVDVKSVQQVATILVDICNSLNIDTDIKYIYLDAQTDSKFIADNYGYDEEAVQLRETAFYESKANESEVFAIIRGDMFNNIMVTKNSLRAHEAIVSKTVAVKTKYLAKQVNNSEDMLDIIAKMLEEGIRVGANVDYNMLGNVVGESFRLLSTDETAVSENHGQLTINGETVYCSNVEVWQIPHTLVKIHTALFNNTAIALKTLIKENALKYYSNEFETTEPSLSLAVRSFTEYMDSCIKNN